MNINSPKKEMWIASTGGMHVKRFDAMLSVNDRGTEIGGDESEMSDTGCLKDVCY